MLLTRQIIISANYFSYDDWNYILLCFQQDNVIVDDSMPICLLVVAQYIFVDASR